MCGLPQDNRLIINLLSSIVFKISTEKYKLFLANSLFTLQSKCFTYLERSEFMILTTYKCCYINFRSMQHTAELCNVSQGFADFLNYCTGPAEPLLWACFSSDWSAEDIHTSSECNAKFMYVTQSCHQKLLFSAHYERHCK